MTDTGKCKDCMWWAVSKPHGLLKYCEKQPAGPDSDGIENFIGKDDGNEPCDCGEFKEATDV